MLSYVVRYINTFPGTPEDFRAWIDGTRSESDITALLDNLEYAYHKAKVVVLEEALAVKGVLFKEAVNPNGDLPEGSANGGSKTVAGVGKVSHQALLKVVAREELLNHMRQTTERLAAIWGALATTEDPARRAKLIDKYGAQLILDSSCYTSLMKELGLKKPYEEK